MFSNLSVNGTPFKPFSLKLSSLSFLTKASGLNGGFVPARNASFSTERRIHGILIKSTGEASNFEIGKEEFAQELHLPLRDLRIISSYPSQVQASLISRNKVILFSINSLKMIIKANEVFVFYSNNQRDPQYNKEMDLFIRLLEKQLKSPTESTQSQSTGTINQNELALPSSFISQQRFEHLALEIAFQVITNSLTATLRNLQPELHSVLNELKKVSKGLDIIQTQVDYLLPLKNQLNEIQKRCFGIRKCLHDLLLSDEDMERMFLEFEKENSAPSASKISSKSFSSESPKQKVITEESFEEFEKGEGIVHKEMDNFGEIEDDEAVDHYPPFHRDPYSTVYPRGTYYSRHSNRKIISLELLLENYLNEFEWILSKVDNVINEVKNSEENVTLQLDLIRNRILKFELFLSISTFVVSSGALITGLFGMNLLNHYEHHYSMFSLVSSLIFSSMLLFYLYFMKYAHNERLF